jgi:hypothetical protein
LLVVCLFCLLVEEDESELVVCEGGPAVVEPLHREMPEHERGKLVAAGGRLQHEVEQSGPDQGQEKETKSTTQRERESEEMN